MGFFVGYTELFLCSNKRLDKSQATPSFGRSFGRVWTGVDALEECYIQQTYGLDLKS